MSIPTLTPTVAQFLRDFVAAEFGEYHSGIRQTLTELDAILAHHGSAEHRRLAAYGFVAQ